MEYFFRGFRIFVEDDYGAMSIKAAELLAGEIRAKPDGVFGFATGGTPVGMYKELIKMNVDFSRISSFNLDEYFPISKSNPQSYYRFMHENLFDHVNIKPENINIPNGESEDGEAESLRYSSKIASLFKCGSGGIDLQLLGIGGNGHIGFNEPDSFFAGETHMVQLKESTINANARFFDNPADVPRAAITMGIREIMHARKVLLIANGDGKADIISKTLCGQIVPEIPASVLQFHHDVTVVLDRAAASEIIKIL